MRCKLCWANACGQYVLTNKETDEIEDVMYLCEDCLKDIDKDKYINKQREVRKIKDRIDAMDSIPEIADVIDSLDEETKTMLLKMYAYA